MTEIAGWLPAQWPAPDGVVAGCTTRMGPPGAASTGAYADFNLAGHVGDQSAAVAHNRHLLLAALPGVERVQWLQQVHGTGVLEATPVSAAAAPEADACVTGNRGLACAVLTADCLPVLFCHRAGTGVAAAHAGWRGLAAGVLEQTVRAMACPPGETLAWLGPAIGPAQFEVGPEVREAFLVTAGTMRGATEACFVPRASRPGHYFADLYQLARLRLAAAGVIAVYGGGACTVSDERFYSYRRDGVSGRMASLICRRS